MNIEVLFKWILAMTISGSAAVLVFAVLSKIFKEHLSARARYYIWLIVLFCFMIPWNVLFNRKSSLKVLNQSVILDGRGYTVSSFSQSSVLNLQSVKNSLQGGALEALPSGNVGYFNPGVLHEVIAYVWLIGAVVFFVRFLIRYIWFKVIVTRNSRECSDKYCRRIIGRYCRLKRISGKIKVLESDIIQTPMLIGTVKPILLMPAKDIAREDLRLIIRHELVHFRRKDVLIKWFSKLINALHWFNPLVYFAVLKLSRECEYSCDEEVIRKLKENGKRRYAEALYNTLLVSISSGAGAAFGLVGRKESIVDRFRFIMNLEVKKMSKITKVFLVVLVSTTIFLSAFVQIWAKDILGFDRSETEAIKSTIPDEEKVWLLHFEEVVTIPVSEKGIEYVSDMTGTGGPEAFDIKGDKVYIVDNAHHRILVYNKTSGQLIEEVKFPENIVWVSDISADGKGNLYLLGGNYHGDCLVTITNNKIRINSLPDRQQKGNCITISGFGSDENGPYVVYADLKEIRTLRFGNTTGRTGSPDADKPDSATVIEEKKGCLARDKATWKLNIQNMKRLSGQVITPDGDIVKVAFPLQYQLGTNGYIGCIDKTIYWKLEDGKSYTIAGYDKKTGEIDRVVKIPLNVYSVIPEKGFLIEGNDVYVLVPSQKNVYVLKVATWQPADEFMKELKGF
ncbi:M56 family metallopeptidase [Caldicellulosiruptor morganii]|uniref:Peptidase M56 domain-containing protein n=1 Tax=Caldicellulosiruptor morganii TaxID=1387555 RepID=A0ABY7BLP6_9FIRM|nr:M56 family metallopeptidase [Caldicellulosiruptor morganii]WAM32822.1 hypothetical protein OTK00_001269 [Caldicellulosiruptor morganii]